MSNFRHDAKAVSVLQHARQDCVSCSPADRDPFLMACGQAVRNCSTSTKGLDLDPALTPMVKVSSPPLQAGGVFPRSCQPRRSAGSPAPAAGSEMRRTRRPRKSSGPPPFAPSLNVQRDDTHGNSGFCGLTPFNRQLPEVVRIAMGATVFRIRTKLIFRRCCNLITPSRSCGEFSTKCRPCRYLKPRRFDRNRGQRISRGST